MDLVGGLRWSGLGSRRRVGDVYRSQTWSSAIQPSGLGRCGPSRAKAA